MKTKIKYLLVLVLASFVFAGCTTTFNGSCKTKQWEYKSVNLCYQSSDFQAGLNKASQGGWRLIAIAPPQSVDGCNAQYIFERPKQ
jgi:hypothetical protein